MRLHLPPKLTFALVLGALLGATPASALSVLFLTDSDQSSVQQGDVSVPLSGFFTLDLGELPPLAATTNMDVVSFTAFAGGLFGLSITLDDGLANPGLGVLFTDGTFLIPSLHLVVDGSDLTITELTGTLSASLVCPAALCFELQTAFDVEPPSGGTIHVSVVAGAAVPEPAPAVLAAVVVAAAALGSTRLRRGSL